MVISHLRRLKNMFLVLILMQLFTSLSLSFVGFFFKEQGFSLWSLILLNALLVGVGCVSVLVVRVIYVKRFWLIGIFLHSVLLFLLAYFRPMISYAGDFIILGVNMLFFWLPCNYLFFTRSSKETNAMDAFLYLVAPGFLAILLPPFGAWIINTYGYGKLFYLSGVLYVIPLLVAWRYFEEEKCEMNFKREFREFRGLKTITLLEGALHFFAMLIIPVYALLFLKTEMEVGWFLSYMAVVSFVMGFMVSRYSDMKQQRTLPIFVLFFLLTMATLGLYLVKTLFMWYVMVGIFTVFNTISSPLRLAISMDVKEVNMGFWRIREFFLNAGRVVTLGLSAVLFYYEWYGVVFGLFAGLMLMYPFLMRYKLRELR